LVNAHARLDQSSAVAQTSGPLLAGALVSVFGAPIAVVVDAVTYLVSGIAIGRIRVVEPIVDRSQEAPTLRREIADGLRWVYRHETLAPLAISTHGWFLFNSMLTTIYVSFVLVGLALSPFQLGVTFAVAGAAGLAGAFVAVPLGRRWGAGPVVIIARSLMPVAWTVVVLASLASLPWIAVVVLCAGQAIIGLAMGAENANEMAYWQALTPDEMQSRMNTTRRSVNRAMIVIGAPVGGILADGIGYVPAMVIAIIGFVAVAVFLAISPFRSARNPGEPEAADSPT
jgi:MFS family permease